MFHFKYNIRTHLLTQAVIDFQLYHANQASFSIGEVSADASFYYDDALVMLCGKSMLQAVFGEPFSVSDSNLSDVDGGESLWVIRVEIPFKIDD